MADSHITYRFRVRGWSFRYSFGVPWLPDTLFALEKTETIEMEAVLEHPSLKALRRAGATLYANVFDLSKGRTPDSPRSIGTVSRSKGGLDAYLFVPADALAVARQLLLEGKLREVSLFAPPLQKLQAPISQFSFTAAEDEYRPVVPPEPERDQLID